MNSIKNKVILINTASLIAIEDNNAIILIVIK